MGPVDIVVLVIVAGLLGLAIWRLVKRKRQGKCSCGCDGCSQRDCCHDNGASPNLHK